MKSNVIISRGDDRIIIMTPDKIEDARCHAIITEDEAFCACGFLRRMLNSPERREIDIGSEDCGLRISKVNHQKLPIEIHFDDDNGTTTLDFSKEDAANIADMLWAAHRSNNNFYVKTSISASVRRTERVDGPETIIPVPDDMRSTNAETLGYLAKRAKGVSTRNDK